MKYQTFSTSRSFTYSYSIGKPTEPASGPALLFLHGFPTTSHLWKHQLPFFQKQGFVTIAIDLLGFGGSSKPKGVGAYRASLICDDIIELLDSEGFTDGQVIPIGHDLGSKIVSRLANYYPHRFLAFAFLAVPYLPPRPKTDIDYTLWATKKMSGYELCGHTLFYGSDIEAPGLIEKRVDSFMSAIFPEDPKLWVSHVAPVGALKHWLEGNSRTALAPYIDTKELRLWRELLQEGGIRPALSWYQAFISGMNAEDDKQIIEDKYHIEKPVFFGAANYDYISQSVLGIATTKYHCKNATIRGFSAGHWLMMSHPAEVNASLFSWVMDCL